MAHKQGLGLERRGTLELRHHPRSIGLERIRAGAVGAGRFGLAGHLPQPLIFPGSADAHPGACCRLFLGFP
ncbi:MAG: hypothetical protein HC828_08685 [Blastochloris sp.]|nr:hypothetical protein [Blastochloris sp.]